MGSRNYATESRVASASASPRKPHFDKILIANRGEIACRVIRTARKLGIKTVAVYSDVDKDSLHVKLADEAYNIGPAPSAESYLRMDKIIQVCHQSGAQAVHPGYGFLSENAKFAEQLAAEGIVFIGPPASAIISMGSKSESKNIMSSAGVPCVPGYHGDKQDPDFLFQEAQKIGFPVLIKAIHGGGGKGMRTVLEPTREAFEEGLLSAKRESLKSFGNDTVLVEKYIQRPRHVEVQVFADTLGNVVSLWERDCSVQRRNQKIIEEAPAPGLSPELRADLSAKAIAAARAVNYVGAGTVEFIFDNDTQDFYFMEMNTRLQVEHPVTEMITGLDLVEWQLEVAAGNPLPLSQSSIPLVGHAFEARIYAENPRNNFLPDSGNLLYLSTPPPTHVFAPTFPSRTAEDGASLLAIQPSIDPSLKPALRIEQGFTQGAQIGVFYDPMIAKVVVHGSDRTEALRMLRKALDDYHVVGVSTNVEFLRTLAGNSAFIEGDVETGFIPKHFQELFPPLPEPSPEVLAQVGLFVALRDAEGHHLRSNQTSPWSTLASRRFGGDKYRRTITLQTDDAAETPITVEISPVEGHKFDVVVNAPSGKHTFSSVPAQLVDSTTLSSQIGGRFVRPTIVSQPPPPGLPASQSHNSMERVHIFSDGQKTSLVIPSPKWLQSLGSDVLNAHKGGLRAPMPSLVVEVRVKPGDRVEKGQAVVVLESMKTETVLRSDVSGIVKAVGCKNGEMVEEGRELVDIEPEEVAAD
ncbi:biotin/lipoyl attachment:Carbamoyl-phosphate synthase subunit L [Coprinopsis cinerea AmutBmut pab1-1]|nr:biotin/lipoyl attachment:Carbamoyl-phosphate synthase subunit L [Coprinopsis cinerea AmutBmut pab1-1]